MRAGAERSCGFLAFEGIDGSGKSTQLGRLAGRLRRNGYRVHETAEPTLSPFGALIRNIMTGRITTAHSTIAALFVADRLDHILNPVDGMQLKLSQGCGVLSDRYYFSSYAYHTLHVPLEWVVQANSICRDLLSPDLTIFIDVPVEECVARLSNGGRHLELYEREEDLRRVRENYFRAFELFEGEERYAVVDGLGAENSVEQRIWELLVERGVVDGGGFCEHAKVADFLPEVE